MSSRLPDPELADCEVIADRLRNARLERKPLKAFPGSLPQRLATAYSIQALSISRWADQVAGWKVGGVPPSFQPAYGVKRLAGPIFRRGVQWTQDDQSISTPVFAGGFAAVEAEFVFQLTNLETVPAANISLEDALNTVGRVFIGVEIASSPLAPINEIGPAAVVSDFGNNAGLIIGQELRLDQIPTLSDIDVRVSIEGETVGEARARDGEDGPLGAVRFLLSLWKSGTLQLEDGHFISCGAITGVHESPVGSVSEVAFAGFPPIHLSIEAFC